MISASFELFNKLRLGESIERRDHETNYSRLRMAIGRNQEVVTKFQDRQTCTSVARRIVIEQFAAEA